jgi:16S rRNA (cytosine1402-N4)-methyltransferase
MHEARHTPVLLDQTLEVLNPQPGETYVDCTLGLGGHASAVSARVGTTGTVVGFDLDAGNLKAGGEALAKGPAAFRTVQASFQALWVHVESLGVKADMVLADLGFSSNQMDDPGRGFSFKSDGPLDMRLNPDDGRTAAELVATMDESELADVIFHLGEDPFARRIARKVIQARVQEPIRTTAQLARIVCEAYGPRARASRMHPATRTFMALRIAVNDELNALSSLMDQVARGAEQAGQGGWLNLGARVAVISFHSLEDRMVKQRFGQLAERGLATRLTKKPMIASESEIAANPRARSAKLRGVRIARTAMTNERDTRSDLD